METMRIYVKERMDMVNRAGLERSFIVASLKENEHLGGHVSENRPWEDREFLGCIGVEGGLERQW